MAMYIALRRLIFSLGFLVFVASGFWSAAAHAGVATYIDCYFEPKDGAEATDLDPGVVLRFMLNTKLELAFRIDTAVARPVLLYVEEGGSFTLLDYRDNSDVILVTVQASGESIFSRHRLVPPPGMSGALGSQRMGRCEEPKRLALMALPLLTAFGYSGQ